MDWTLTDHRLGPITPADWAGRPAMVVFGLTHCPDVYPTTLLDIADWIAELGDEAAELTVALTTADPERDTPQVLAEYVENFDSRILALSGTKVETTRAAEEFSIVHERVPVEGPDYTMDHSAAVFLFHRGGRFGGTIDFHGDRRFALPKLRQILKSEPPQAAS